MFDTHTLQGTLDQFGRAKVIVYSVHKTEDLVLVDDGFNFNMKYSKNGARLHAKNMMTLNPDLKFVK